MPLSVWHSYKMTLQHGVFFVCSCDIPGVPHDDFKFKSTQNGGSRARFLQVFPLPVEEVEQERQSFSGILILFTVNF